MKQRGQKACPGNVRYDIMMPYEKPIKSERVTLRMMEETKRFIETFGGDGEDKFSIAFDNMIEHFNGEKIGRIKKEIKKLEENIKALRKEEEILYSQVTTKLRDATYKLGEVERYVNRLHETAT
jgi:archaellum component FlaC